MAKLFQCTLYRDPELMRNPDERILETIAWLEHEDRGSLLV